MNLNIQQKHMIDRQLMPNFIIDEKIIKIFSIVKREDFLPNKFKNIAYIDDNIFFEDRFMLRTLYLAKILTFMKLNKSYEILDIGCASGYSSIIFNHFFKKVLAFETNKKLFSICNDYINQKNLISCNIINADIKNYELKYKFDYIFINGLVDEIPEFLKKNLKQSGEIYAIYNPKFNTSYFCKFKLNDSDQLDVLRLFEASAPLLISLKNKKKKFSF